MATVKERIQTICSARHMSIKQLEKELGFSNGTIQKWNKFNPRMENLTAVALHLNVPVESLMGDSMPEQKENPIRFDPDEELKNAEKRGKYSHFIELLDMSTPEAQQEALALLISRLHSRVNQDEQK